MKQRYLISCAAFGMLIHGNAYAQTAPSPKGQPADQSAEDDQGSTGQRV